MSRKIIAIAVCLVLISVGSYLFYHIGMTNKTTSNPYSAIPSSSALVLQINDALNVFQQITTTNIMWEEVNKTELFSRLNDNLVFLNHFAEKDEDVKRLFKKGKLLISGEKTSGMDYNFLFCVSIPSDVSNKSLTTLPKEIFDKIGEISKRKFQDLELVEVVLNSDSLGSDSIQKKFNYLVHHGLFIGSFDGGLVEKSVNTFINGDGLDKNAAFQHIKSTSAQDVDANLFIACKAFNNIAQLHLRPEESNAFLENIGQWIELDVQIKPDEINMNGFIQSSDSLDYNVDLFKNQVPQKIEAFQYIPDNVAFLMHLGLSNYRNYQEEYSKIFRTEDRKAKIQKLNDHFGVNMEEDFNSWIENEIVQIILEPTNGLSAEHHFGLLRSKNLQRSKTILQELVLKSNENTDYSPAVLLNQYEVNRINIRNLIPLLMGPRFKNLENAYYTFVNNYVLWGNSVEAINKYLIKIDRGNTLKLDPHFQNFEQHLSGESNVLIYSSIARSPEIYKEIVSTSLETGIDSNLAILRKFFGGAIQIISDKSNMYFTNFYLKYDPVYKKETSSLWELALDTISDMKPFLHTNHYTYNKEVLVQDINNKIYLISPTGKLLWKRQLDE
ncbi:MAG: DUF3352 domain-containing protein, partial [Flavobacteriales bacterium]|nr:DUF3352 domain-containing protein [Flavobacteriales bacterium]